VITEVGKVVSGVLKWTLSIVPLKHIIQGTWKLWRLTQSAHKILESYGD
jgi:hypothetical protein